MLDAASKQTRQARSRSKNRCWLVHGTDRIVVNESVNSTLKADREGCRMQVELSLPTLTEQNLLLAVEHGVQFCSEMIRQIDGCTAFANNPGFGQWSGAAGPRLKDSYRVGVLRNSEKLA